MSRIDELIAELCPNGVEVKALGDFAQLVRGNGMPKTDLTDSGVGAIHYGQIYTKYGVWAMSTLSFVAPSTAAKLAKADPGDVIITNTSENIDDVGKAVAWLGENQIVTGGHATIIKHSMEPKYLSYWFQSPSFFEQKKRLATGTKVIDVSARQLAKVRVPVPPVKVQREIVRILDDFIELETKLTGELEARRVQYAHYRDTQLTFPASVRRVQLGQFGSIFGGLTGKSKADFSNGNSRFVSYVNVFNNIGVDTAANDFVHVRPGEKQRSLQRGDIIFTGSSETADEVGMSSVVTADVAEPLYLNSFCIGFRPADSSLIDPDFAKHLFRSGEMRRQITRTASGVTRFNVSKARLAKIEVPIPPMEEQRRLASLLDNFEALVNNLSIGLPAELRARRKQYEHYRDRLLTFQELSA